MENIKSITELAISNGYPKITYDLEALFQDDSAPVIFSQRENNDKVRMHPEALESFQALKYHVARIFYKTFGLGDMTNEQLEKAHSSTLESLVILSVKRTGGAGNPKLVITCSISAFDGNRIKVKLPAVSLDPDQSSYEFAMDLEKEWESIEEMTIAYLNRKQSGAQLNLLDEVVDKAIEKVEMEEEKEEEEITEIGVNSYSDENNLQEDPEEPEEEEESIGIGDIF